MRAALAPMVHSGRKRGLNKWFEYTINSIDMHQKVAMHVASLTSGLRKALNMWQEAWLALYPLKRAVSHWRKEALVRGWYSWCEHLVVLVKKQTALNHLLYRSQARGLRAWKGRVDDAHLTRISLARLAGRDKYKALLRWRGSARWREQAMSVMRGKLLIMAGDHRCLKALNSWRHLLIERRLMLRALAASFHRAQLRAFHRMFDRVVRAEAVRRKVVNALTHRAAKALRTWVAAVADEDCRFKALGYWMHKSIGHAMNRWFALCVERHLAKRALAHWLNAGLSRALFRWCSHMSDVALMRKGLSAFCFAEMRRALNTWESVLGARAETLRMLRRAGRFFCGSAPARAFNSWRRYNVRNLPLRQGAEHWRNQPQTKAINKMRAHASTCRSLRGKLQRMRNRRVSTSLNTWVSHKSTFSRARGVGRGFFMKSQRRALNTWGRWYVQRRRITGLVRTFRAPKSKKALHTWRSATMLRPKALEPPSPISPTQKRFIKAMTWREVCSWLTLIGIPVSRSPPTLLRSLKEGLVYVELVHRICLAAHSPYFQRHNVAKAHEKGNLYMTIQHFFDSELVISCVGCQKIDVMALQAGKAREHLDLVETFKTILTAVRQIAQPHIYNVSD